MLILSHTHKRVNGTALLEREKKGNLIPLFPKNQENALDKPVRSGYNKKAVK
jgi:hypothetical protein